MFNPEFGSREPEEEIPQQEQIEPKEQEEPEKTKEGLFRRMVGEKVQGIVNESRLPNEDYKSTVGVYGGKMKIEADGKMVWDRIGIVSKIDTAGDAILRSYDEHVVKEPGKLLKMHPKIAAEKFLHPGTKRYRGDNTEVLQNIERLGLSDYYGAHENGIEIKKPEIYTHGIVLQDVYRSDLIGSDKLEEINRLEALAKAAEYAKSVHDKHGGIGELLVSDIIFQKNDNGKLEDPVLNLPDIVWNEEKNTSETDKKTTDLLDFLCSVYGEELRRSQDQEAADKALDIVLENYGDSNTISLVESFVKRGRLTLQGDAEFLNLPQTITRKVRGIFSQHNKARLAAKTKTDGLMKEKIILACERFLKNSEQKQGN